MTQRRPIVPFRAVPALLLLATLGGCGGGAAKGKAPVPVRVIDVASSPVAVEVLGIGTVTPINSVAIKSRVDGQIVTVAVREGADVQRGDLLFRIDPRPFEVARDVAAANLARDEALLAKSQDLLTRSDELIAKGYISANQYSDARGDARAAAAAVAGDRAALENARLNLEFTELRAPIAGRVGRVLLQQGNLVKANDTVSLLSINQIDPIYVDFAVPERNLADVRAAAARGGVEVVLVADAGAGQPLQRSGPLTFLDNQVDQPTGTVRLRATLKNTDRSLWPGQFARVTVQVPVGGLVTWVPAAALGQNPEGTYVWVVDDKLAVAQRPVRVARTEGDRVVLAEGVHAGERVVIDGQSRILPGAAVVIEAPAPAAALPAAPGGGTPASR